MANRYKLGDDDQVEHSCCHRAVVVDTQKPVVIGGKHPKNRYEAICECSTVEIAQQIVDALNKTT